MPSANAFRRSFEGAESSQAMDVGGLILRARRHGDLSQRELAAAVGVSQSTVAALEAGARDPALSLFRRILAAGGLRLAVVDSAGQVVAPVSPDTVRDNGGRRLPAHLDADPPDRRPWYRSVCPEKGREPVKAWYRMREERDRVRDGATDLPDHPTRTELEARRRRQLYGPRPPAPGSEDASAHLDCECETECWLGTACAPECLCQCEPLSGAMATLGRLHVSQDSDSLVGPPSRALDCEVRTPGPREQQ
ncbi:helix-turn-helix transcriptional regulator [Intrasporangium sp. DVR]|uniref:helix-turn-helix domain-containing protein n=1 Tax=Intrasporangium sp. DVR TaxID=3127867 RepID=UPI00313A53AA